MEGIVHPDKVQTTQPAAARPSSPSRAFLIRRLKALGAEAPPPAPPGDAPLHPAPAQRRATVTGLPPQTGTFTVLRLT